MIILVVFISLVGCSDPEKITLNISAATSLTDAINEVNVYYLQENSNLELLTNFAASGDLQTQIENGAPVDIFISASPIQMDNLEAKDLILNDTRQDLISNRIVLITLKDKNFDFTGFENLMDDKITLIAMGDPEFVPAGYYGRQVFDFLDLPFEEILHKFVLTGNVRQVVGYVESGNVDAGILFTSDVVNSDRVRIVAIAPDEINNTILYPVAIIASSTRTETARSYVEFLFTTVAQEIFEKHGFLLIQSR
ncbi:MAG: molybdate ABC transporter substrate-binding protein [Bacillota bacterium]|nr:molybdate ABC transporter substrate-binding protein [Bacillota bacterium]